MNGADERRLAALPFKAGDVLVVYLAGGETDADLDTDGFLTFVKDHGGLGLVVLRPGEDLQTVDETSMNRAGWYRAPA